MSEPDAMVFVVDDDAQTRDALKNLMRSVGLHVEVFASAQDFLRSKRPDVPACLVLDVRLRGLSGLDLQKRMAEAKIEVPIIFITGYGDIPMTVQAMKAGAVEFLTKPFRNQELLDAIQQALERDRTTREQRAKNDELYDRYDSLTPREREVMTLVVAGLLNKQIAGELRHQRDYSQKSPASAHGKNGRRFSGRAGQDGLQARNRYPEVMLSWPSCRSAGPAVFSFTSVPPYISASLTRKPHPYLSRKATVSQCRYHAAVRRA